MEQKLFEQLVESVKEARSILERLEKEKKEEKKAEEINNNQ